MRFNKSVKRVGWIAAVVLGIGAVSFRNDDRLFEIARNLDIYATLYKELNTYYVDEVNPNSVIKTSIDAMLQSLDPYTVYYAEDDIEDFMTLTTGKYNGIGALVNSANGKYIVMMVYEGTPAEKAGIRLGDEILKIDDVEVAVRRESDSGKLLKGQTGTNVKLTVKRFGHPTPIDIMVGRDVVKMTNVPYYGMLDEETGYIDLKDFTATAAKEVQSAFQELKGKGMKKLILDVRDNPGGLLDMAINISNFFVPKGKEIVSTKGKITEWNKKYVAQSAPIDTDIPLIVLTSNRSASAAEIVSGVMQDYDRGVLVGQRTYGKGLVQTTRDLSYNTKMKITTAKYYIPSGRCIQAIDYSLRNDDGSVAKIPDSLMTPFKTANGRVVYDGGGVLPDVEVERDDFSPIANSLGANRLFFDYAVKYHAEHATIKPAKDFELSEAEYKEFEKWLGNKDYDYETQVENDLAELEASAKKEKSFASIEGQFKALKAKLTHSKENDLQIHKAEIKYLLEEEIVKHYYLEKGFKEASFKNDGELRAALDLFKDMPRYQNILKAQK